MTTAAEPTVPPRRRLPRFPLWVCGIGAILLGLVWGLPAQDLERWRRSAATWMLVPLILLALAIWVLFFSRWRWTTRFAALLLPIALVAGTVQGVEYDGDMMPIAVQWRWAQTAGSTRDAYQREHGKAGLADLNRIETTDFIGYFGNDRQGIVVGPALQRDWASHPPKLIWKQPSGEGFSGFAVVGDSLVTQEQLDNEEAVVCYEATTGKERWSHRYPTRFSEFQGGPGPRATPTVFGGDVYAYGAEGRLVCVDGSDGRLKWEKKTLTENDNLMWGVSASPLVFDDVVVVTPGAQRESARGRSVIAFDRLTGSEIWATGDAKASYSSPMLAMFAGQRQLVIFDAAGLSGVDPVDGKSLWHFPWKNPQDANVAQPLVLPGNRVFITSAYGAGCALVQVTENKGTWAAQQVWKNDKMRCRFTSPVFYNGHLYGLDEGVLECLDAASGNRVWKDGRYGNGQMLLSGDLLVILAESGHLALVEASPNPFRELGKIRALDGRKTWNPPALADGKVYVRNHHQMACYDLVDRAQ